MKFLQVDSVEAAREKLLDSARGWLARSELVPLADALGRVLAEDVYAGEDIPAFRRSTVDGYAVLSKDTAAAGESLPVFLTVRDRIEMGALARVAIRPGECAEVPTGGMLPDGADAVVMVEYAEPFGAEGVALYHGVANGENVVQVGEDAGAGALLLACGRVLRPQDVGALAAAGVDCVPVAAKPRLCILSTGDELVSPGERPTPGQVRDINTHALAAQAAKHGFEVVDTAVLPDDEALLSRRLREAMLDADIIAVSGGSSKGNKDATASAIDAVSEPGVFVHGVALKPGKPTILGYDRASSTILAGLPGHPVSAMMVFELLLNWLLRALTGGERPPAIPARLACNVASSPGKLTCWPVRLELEADGGYTAQPVFGKSGLITTLTGADGYFAVDRDAEGLSAGATVLVHLF